MTRRAMPILAATAMALSLAACSWMGGGSSKQASASHPTTSNQTASALRYPQEVSPGLVAQIQRNLGQQGYDPGAVDGVWGDSTASSLRRFQRDHDLQATGRLNTQTLAALGIQPSSQTAQNRPYQPMSRRGAQLENQSTTQQAMAPAVTRDVQQELNDRGYHVGQVDGQWGRNSQQALENFQRDQNLPATGRLDQDTLAALGIDTDVQVGQMPNTRAPDIGPAERPTNR